MIVFNESSHSYTHLESGNNLNGWTTLIKKYTQPFDMDTQLVLSAYSMFLGKEYTNLKFGKFKNSKPEVFLDFLQTEFPDLPQNFIKELQYEWGYSAIRGSEFHSFLENKTIEQGFDINPFTDEKYLTINIAKDYDNQSLKENLFDLEDGYYPELLVWDYSMGESCSPVTMIDRCYIKTINNVRFVDVGDYKTNKSIWNGKDRKMSGVLSNFYDNTEDKYKLQVCFGAKLLSTFGFTPRFCGFSHYKNYNEKNVKLYLAKYDAELMDAFQKDWRGF
ncbi:MAG: hypothetical protein KBE73_04585 [Fusobacteriaceae bacterium]|nr:hypothetical protein [Fusobacteriaceae bacterium]